MSVDFTQAVELAKLSAGRCAKRYHLDYDVCLSEAYLAISAKLPKFSPEKSSLPSFVYRIVTNQIVDYLRSENLTLRAKLTEQASDTHEFASGGIQQFSDDADTVINLALTLADEVRQPARIRKEVASRLKSKGWSQSRIAEAFESVAESLDCSSPCYN